MEGGWQGIIVENSVLSKIKTVKLLTDPFVNY